MSERKASMGDKVYRGDVIKYIRNNISLDTFMKRTIAKADESCWDLCDKLNFVPAIEEAEPEQKWIPVGERLPEEKSNWKNVTVLDENGDSAFTYVSVGYYLSDGWWIVDNEPMEDGNLIRVIAWMPLPEAYKGDES